MWSTAAIGSGMTPATTPPVMPQTMIGPAAGTASRFAGSAASGIGPNVGMITGATPSWAAMVTAAGYAMARGPGSRAAIGPLSNAMPLHAPTDMRKPTDCTSIGSTSTSSVTASATSRMVETGRPITAAPIASAAIASARSTDGSHRVSSPNPSSTTRPTANRARIPSRRRSGAASTRTNATFSPLTTSRWVRPLARKLSVTSCGCSRSSPRTNPENNDRLVRGNTLAPRANVRRIELATRVGSDPGDDAPTSRSETCAAMCRRAKRARIIGETGRNVPWITTRSPASRGRNALAAAPCAHSSTWRW